MLPLEEEKDHLVIETPTCSQIIWDFYIWFNKCLSGQHQYLLAYSYSLCKENGMKVMYCTLLHGNEQLGNFKKYTASQNFNANKLS